MSPISSAIGMKTSGPIIPDSGWFHRASISKPTMSPGGQVHLRLEEGHELAVVEADADPLLDLGVGDQRALHPGVEPDRPGDPPAARMVHRDVGAAQQVGNADVAAPSPTRCRRTRRPE